MLEHSEVLKIQARGSVMDKVHRFNIVALMSSGPEAVEQQRRLIAMSTSHPEHSRVLSRGETGEVETESALAEFGETVGVRPICGI